MSAAVIANFVAALAAAAATPGIGNDTVLRWFNIAALLSQTANDFVSEMQALTAQIQQMVNEKRPPNPDEWQSLGMRSDMLTDAINRAAAQ